MSRPFKLHHHKHTGKLIHHRHTSYWALILLVLFSGALVLFIDRSVRANTLNVSATVPAPIPSSPSVFTPRTAAQRMLSTARTTITGTCPVISPSIIVVIYRGTEALGSSVCSPTGEFSIEVTLQSGAQTLIARILTITGQWGLDSDPMELTYTPPVATTPTEPTTPTVPAQPITGEAPSIDSLASPLLIQLEKPVITYRPGHEVRLKAMFSGGVLPYTIVVDWGDGSSSTVKIENHEYETLSHIYKTSDVSHFTITMRDANDNSLVRTYAVVNVVPSAITSGLTAAGVLDTFAPNMLDLTIAAYCVLLLGLLTLWRYEFIHYKNRVGIPTHYSWQHKKAAHK